MAQKKSNQISDLELARNALGKGHLEEAEKFIQSALEQNGENPLVHAYRAEIYTAQGAAKPAAEAYEAAVALRPDQGVFWNGLGLARFHAGELEAAVSALTRAVELLPDQAEVHNNLGNLHREMAAFDAAHESYRRAIELKPDYGEAHGNLGVLLLGLGDLEEARKALEIAVGLRPHDPTVLTGLGCALAAVGAITEAVCWHRRALDESPESLGALNNLAIALKDQGQIDEATETYDRLIKLAPDDMSVHSNRLMCMHYREDRDGKKILSAHRQWSNRFKPKAVSKTPLDRNPDRKLKVGYVSPDFWTHSVANFVVAPLRHHDRNQFHVTCYSDTQSTDTTTGQLRALSDQWHDVRFMDDEALLAQVQADEIDILVDLAGHTADNRLTLFACRAAPVQMTWIGYPATTGLEQMDMRLTDEIADPSGATEPFHSETLFRPAPCFLCYTPPEETPAVGGCADEITFASFNNFSKVTDEMVRVWGRLLGQMPDAQILLKSRQLADPVIGERLKQLFEGEGVSPERVKLMPRVTGRENHLAIYNEVDIALDTFPYNGTTTTCEALLMGVPVVTLSGALHAGRVGASLLSAIGREDWIADSEEAYLKIAMGLAESRPSKEDLRRAVLESPLTDGRNFTRQLETGYRSVWRERGEKAVD